MSRYRCFEPITQRQRTTDAMLSAPTPAELQAYAKSVAQVDLGKLYTGLLQPLLAGLSTADRKRLLDRAMVDVEIAEGEGDPGGVAPPTNDSAASRRGTARQLRDQATNAVKRMNADAAAAWK